jgi:CheY-specific phosphatase CheX
MSIKFFGQYLIEQGVVDSDQIRAALKLMDDENRSLGELAEAGGILTAEEAAKVNAQQRYCDIPFGELAVETGLLSEEQVEYLIGFQDQTRLRIGQALVRLEFLSNEHLLQLLVRFESEQALFRIGNVALPDGLESNALAATVLDLFPKLLVRVARIDVRIAKYQAAAEIPDHPVRIAVAVTGDVELVICLLGDEEFSLRLAGATAGFDEPRLEATRQNPVLLADGVGEFLNVLAGNAMGLLERKKFTTELEPPHCDPELESGYLFDLAVSVGKAALYLKPL